MSDNEARAQQMIQQADKLKSGGGGFLGFGGPKYEEAAELYVKAGNMLKLAKKLEAAGNTFLKASECNLKSGDRFDAATNLINAANCFRKTPGPEFVTNMKKAVQIYLDEGRFSIAARHQKEIAERCEEENDLEAAVQNYQLAADYYDGERAQTSAHQCLLKVALMSAQLEDYDRAIQIYEEVASASMSSIAKYGAKDYLFRAGLCRLCKRDTIAVKNALERYKEIDPSFTMQRECRLLEGVLAAYESFDVEAFTNAVIEFDSVSKLDAWKTTILLRIKKALQEDDPSLM